ncbi:hypothetical protein QCA50_013191 [Cerrena zonata]|uniref:Uncharacterized protein n=1 Tax=Cerrena zonata TaxID=2478898 RepID=A0AAW0G424_9APHY
MFNFFMTSVFSLFFLVLGLQTVQATIFVTAPLAGSECHGGQPCTVQWLDNGAVPLLSTIGPCHVGLYNGEHVLVQQIDPVNVASVHSFQFTPDPQAGPSSDTYYVNFTSLNPIGDAANYYQYSPFFKLTGMSGSFASPLASATSTLAVPSSIASASPNSVSVTVTVGASTSSVISQTSSPTPSSSTFSSASSSSSETSSVLSSSISASSAQSSSASASPTPSASSSSSFSSSSGASSSLRASSTFTTSRLPSATPSSAAASVASPSSTTSSASLSAEFRLIPAFLAFSLLLSFSFL